MSSPTTNILITGASGFIGQLMAAKLLSSPSYHVTLTDIIEPPIPGETHDEIITEKLDALYLLHGIMSSGSEANFDLGMAVNFDSTRLLLERLRAIKNSTGKQIRVIYASSQAVYGQPLPSTIDDSVIATPESSYGAEKLMCEILINEYNRRGWITGFALRFPTICVRPGKPTAAASSFLSGMIREPLQGLPCVIPLKDRSFTSNLCSPRILAENLVRVLSLPADSLPPHIRVMNIPGISVSIQEMIDALEKVGRKEAVSLLREATDPAVERIVRSWGTHFDAQTALKLGLIADESFEEAVKDFQKSLAME